MRRSGDRKTARLLDLPLFAAARASDLRSLASAADEVVVPKGGTLPANACYLLVDGSVRVGDSELGPGQFVGVLAAFDGGASASDAVAAVDVTALVLPSSRLRALIETNHIVREAVLRHLVTLARAA